MTKSAEGTELARREARTRPLQDTAGIAREIKASKRTVQNLMVRRVIPYLKIGRLVRFDVEKVRAALGQLEVRAVGSNQKQSSAVKGTPRA
jgi:hypothetical protein